MVSPLASIRRKYQPKLPPCFNDIENTSMIETVVKTSQQGREDIEKCFPHSSGLPLIVMGKNDSSTPLEKKGLNIGVVLSGGQAAGGHNVIAGLFDALKKYHPGSKLLGFLKGPKGILDNEYQELDDAIINQYRNQGGFDMIGSGRDKIESPEDLQKAQRTCQSNNLDGLVIVGGDDSNTNAAVLAEYFLEHQVKTSVVGVPKTIDGDLQNDYVQMSFGFDTATKVYANLISNIQKDAKSSCKYTHFIKLMGRSASHIALECALQTHPHYTLISEAIAEKKLGLGAIIQKLCDIVQARHSKGKPYAVFLIPEGVIEFIPQMRTLIDEINQWAANKGLNEEDSDSSDLLSKITGVLSEESQQTWALIPRDLQSQLLMDRDPHGNVQVSHIQTEKLFSCAMAHEFKVRQDKGLGKVEFSPVYHFLGYEGRSTFPTNFDANYCYSLGFVAWLLIKNKATGRMCALKNLHQPASNWEPMGVPITSLMNFEKRKGVMKPVIKKALVDLQGKAFRHFMTKAPSWEEADDDQSVGPIQFEGSYELTDSIPITMQLSSHK